MREEAYVIFGGLIGATVPLILKETQFGQETLAQQQGLGIQKWEAISIALGGVPFALGVLGALGYGPLAGEDKTEWRMFALSLGVVSLAIPLATRLASSLIGAPQTAVAPRIQG